MCAVLASRIAAHKTILPHDYHTWVGTITLCLVAFQATVGSWKAAAQARGAREYAWHGRLVRGLPGAAAGWERTLLRLRGVCLRG